VRRARCRGCSADQRRAQAGLADGGAQAQVEAWPGGHVLEDTELGVAVVAAGGSPGAGAEGARGGQEFVGAGLAVDGGDGEAVRAEVVADQQLLGGEVAVHVAVEVEVVLGEAGEADGVVAQGGDAGLGEGVRGDLHDEVGGAAGEGGGEEGLQLEREGGGEGGGGLVVDDPVAGGADPEVRAGGGAEHGGDQIGDGGLAVGAGDAGEAQVGGGLAEAAGGELREGGGGVGEPHVRVRRRGDAAALQEEDGGAGGGGLREEGVAVVGEAGDGEEGEAGGGAARVDDEAGDLGGGAAAVVVGGQVGEEGAEAHAGNLAAARPGVARRGEKIRGASWVAGRGEIRRGFMRQRGARAGPPCRSEPGVRARAKKQRPALASRPRGLHCWGQRRPEPGDRLRSAGSGRSGGRRRGGRRSCCRPGGRRRSPTGPPSRSG
jgi:hypothetical protein